jgi:two-component system, LytTR family, sensor kinase
MRLIGQADSVRSRPPAQRMTMKPQPSVVNLRSWKTWAVSFGLWTIAAIILVSGNYTYRRWEGLEVHLSRMLWFIVGNNWYGALTTPFVIRLAERFPIEKLKLKRRLLLHLAGGTLFLLLHIGYMMAFLPLRNDKGVLIAPSWQYYRHMLAYGFYADAIDTYVPLVVLAHVMMYYRRNRDAKLRAAQLEAQLSQVQLESLKLQLQPHFLFNTLNAVITLMHRDVGAAERMLTRLSDLLRTCLEYVNVDQVTLKTEMEFVSGYLEIEQTRFGDRLQIVKDIDPETWDALVPNMVLQPIVENALRHGVQRRAGRGLVEITSRMEGEALVLTVRDNGPGFTPGHHGNSGTGIGLKNIEARLSQIYGGAGRLNLRNHAAGGAEVVMELPLHLDVESSVEIPA